MSIHVYSPGTGTDNPLGLLFINIIILSICLIFDLSNGLGFGVGIGLGFGLRNVCEGCFKTTKVNMHNSKTTHRVLYHNNTK